MIGDVKTPKRNGISVRRYLESRRSGMKQANVTALTVLALILFVAGIAHIVLIPYGVLALGLMMASFVLACTIVVINEIREAKRRIIEEMEKRTASP